MGQRLLSGDDEARGTDEREACVPLACDGNIYHAPIYKLSERSYRESRPCHSNYKPSGKSSLSLSAAGEFDLDIYLVSIPDTTDQSLKDLFGQL